MSTSKSQTLVDKYLKFQETCVSPFHTVQTVKNSLIQQGFTELSLDSKWNLDIGEKYFIRHRDKKTILAFYLGEQNLETTGFKIIAAHTDSPTLKMKLNPWKQNKDLSLICPQTHGSLIYRTWLDQPLKVAGMVYKIKKHQGKVLFDSLSSLPKLDSQLVASDHAVGIIPELAIHLDRNKNTSGPINPETQMDILCSTSHSQENFIKSFWSSLGQNDDVDGFDLTFSPHFKHQVVGLDQSLIIGPRHDDLAMSFVGLEALLKASKNNKNKNTFVLGLLDAEETGSQTASGAGSAFFRDCLLNISLNHPRSLKEKSPPDPVNIFSNSYLISADMAHAFHPSHQSKHDTNHRPMLNQGLVVKENTNDRYATTGETHSMFKALCQEASVPLQNYVNRQDMGCGSTIGPILASQLGCNTVDVGLAMLGMHSSMETMGCKDLDYAAKVFEVFYRGSRLN